MTTGDSHQAANSCCRRSGNRRRSVFSSSTSAASSVAEYAMCNGNVASLARIINGRNAIHIA